MDQGGSPAEAIYRSIGVYLGHSLALYHHFYGFKHVLLLGRVMSGRGGDIIFVADDNLSTLMDFRYKRKYTAPDGENGRAKRMSGADGDDLVIRVPRGTVLKEAETDLVVADLTGSEPVVVARGGRGGWGNSHFATPTRQIPKFAKPGLPGEDMHLKLELKVIADVGLIGFPNVGKSTLISIISAARPKIANYHFTTLTPVLGVVRVGPEQSLCLPRHPGLIRRCCGGRRPRPRLPAPC